MWCMNSEMEYSWIKKLRQKDQKVYDNAWSTTLQKWYWQGISYQGNERKGIDKLWVIYKNGRKQLGIVCQEYRDILNW